MATWLITGSSSGLGRALAEAVLARGDTVAVAARRPESVADLVEQYPETALAVELDVTDQRQVDAAVAATIDRFGCVDVLANNAGFGYRAAVEEGDDEGVRSLFETNVFGAIAVLKAVLPQMRAQRSGTILNISSIAASIQPAGSGYYAASKAALEGISGSLAKEVEPLGIKVVTIEPGGFRTEFGGRSITQSPTIIDDYAETSGKRRPVEGVNPSMSNKGNPDKAAQVMIELVLAEAPPRFFLMGGDAYQAVGAVVEQRLDAIREHEALSVASDDE